MAAPMRSTDFRSIVEPILNECFDGVYDQRADEWSRVFREQDGIPRNYHEEPVLYGFGAAPQLPDGTPVSYQQGGVLFLKRYVYNVYGLAFALTKVLVEDGDHIRIIVDRNRLTGSVDLVGDESRSWSPEEGAEILAAREPRSDLRPDPQLPDDTRLWAALQRAGGGTWGGCVYDVDRIMQLLAAGEEKLGGTR